MTKQEEIREEIALKYLQWKENDTTLQLNTTDKFLRSECFDFADEVMEQEHSQGIVIRGETLGFSHPHFAEYYTVKPLI